MDRTTRRTFLQLPAAAVCAGLLPAGAATEPKATCLWYERPASKWEEALAIGNGRLGAMIFGGIGKERLQLNEITVWSGKLEEKADRPEAYKGLAGIRQLIQEGKYPAADKAMLEQRTCQTGGWFGAGSYGSYQTLGDLNFEFAPAPGAVTGYRRWLDIDEAIAGVSWRTGEDTWTRELLSSAVDQVIALRIACTRQGAIAFGARLSRVQFAKTQPAGNETLVMTGSSMGQPDDLRYEAQVRVVAKGGTVPTREVGLRPARAARGDRSSWAAPGSASTCGSTTLSPATAITSSASTL